MKYAYEYSDAELRLIEALDMGYSASSPSTTPPLLYMWMALKCFRNNLNNDISTSVRNCLIEFDKMHTPGAKVRLTPEFDKLILI